jgi:hypothetical protein
MDGERSRRQQKIAAIDKTRKKYLSQLSNEHSQIADCLLGLDDVGIPLYE